jgi:hypothetical protein
MVRRFPLAGRKKHGRGYILDSQYSGSIRGPRYPKRNDGYREQGELWPPPIPYNLLRSSLQPGILVIRFFPVPPSKRQAAGPLTENLPYVCLSGRKTADLSLERPSPRGTIRRLWTHVLPPAPVLRCVFTGYRAAFVAKVVSNLVSAIAAGVASIASAGRLKSNAGAQRLTIKRGHLA